MAGFAAATILTGCGESGSSRDTTTTTSGKGCAPVAGEELVVLADDKNLQTVDNIIPAINTKAAEPPLVAALDKASAALDTPTLIGLNRKADLERQTPANIAKEFVAEKKLTEGLAKGSGSVVVGAANFSENLILANIYALTLQGAGYTATVKTIGNRELYLPALTKGEIQVVPEYVGTLTEFLNKQQNGANAKPLASSDLDKTVAALTELGKKAGLTFGKPSEAADQNAFAVTKKLADEKGLKTLSDFAAKCSGEASVLGGPPECTERPFCKPGLERTYNINFGKFLALDAGGPLTKTGIKSGKVTLGLVFSSDGSLATG
ncbi:MAG TPA: glycine betaine ABC transporter substrate-binding protein [Cryptosporangiaceae bacterium]|nr:glycine betaine ABC transporter substrate-binding protein [Cryptosporangiaceae bacterium]